jgi:hypothetical protein
MNQGVGAGMSPLIEGADDRIVIATKARIKKMLGEEDSALGINKPLS